MQAWLIITCCKSAQLVQFWWDPREFHLDKPASRRPCTTQQFPKQTQPWWGCTQRRQSCRVREPSGHCPGWKPSASAWAGHISSGCCCQKDSWAITKASSKSRGIRENLPTLPPRSCLQCLEDVEKRRERPLCMDDISTSPVWVSEYSEKIIQVIPWTLCRNSTHLHPNHGSILQPCFQHQPKPRSSLPTSL